MPHHFSRTKPGQRYWLTISTANGVAFQAPQHYVVCTLALILAKIKVGFTGKTIGLPQIFVNPLLTARGGISGKLSPHQADLMCTFKWDMYKK